MEVKFQVDGLPPKKCADISMWNQESEKPKLKLLRVAAMKAMDGALPLDHNVELAVDVYANSKDGDLDNLVAGICDGLMAAHKSTPIADEEWDGFPVGARPGKPIVYLDDSLINKIVAERHSPGGQNPWYKVHIKGT